MAYIAQNENTDDTVANVATNLFQQTTGSPQQAVEGQGGAQIAGGGDQSQGISSGGTGSPQQKAAPVSQSASSSKEVIRRNQGKVKSPYDLGAMSQNISTAKKDLQSEANNYVSGQGQKNYGVSDQDISSGLRNDQASFDALGRRLTQARPELEAFNQKTNTDYDSKLRELEDSSLKNYFKSRGGPKATVGEAAFDTLLLNKDKQFKQDREKVQKEAAALSQDTKAIRDRATQEAQAGFQKSYDTETQRIKDTIRGQIDPLRSEAEGRARVENEKRAALEKAAKEGPGALRKTVGADYNTWIRNLANDMGQNAQEDYYLNRYMLNADPSSSDYWGGEINDAATFISPSAVRAQAGHYLNADQANMLNRGQSLLGTGGPQYSAIDPSGLGSAYSFNKDAASAYLNKALSGMRSAHDQALIMEEERRKDEAYQKEVADRAREDSERREREEERRKTMERQLEETLDPYGYKKQAERGMKEYEKLKKGGMPDMPKTTDWIPNAPGTDVDERAKQAYEDAQEAANNPLEKAKEEARKRGVPVPDVPTGGGCFEEGTLFKVVRNAKEFDCAVEKLEPGDFMALGGKIISAARFIGNEIYEYSNLKSNIIVNGSHAVFEGGKWVRVRDSLHAIRRPDKDGIKVYVVWNENHRMLSSNGTLWTDYAETDSTVVNIEEQRNIEALNS